MNELQIFENTEFGKLRTVQIDGEPWFVGKDVAQALGYQNPSKAIADHVDEEDKLNNESLSSLGQRGGWIINESGLYSLVLSSKLESAKKYKRWVTHLYKRTAGVSPLEREEYMNNELQIFENTEFGKLRTVQIDGEPWFIAADVCRALELEQVTNTVKRLDDDEKALISIKGISRGNDEVTAVNEAGLYSLVLSSRKPEAKRFKRWVTHDVIPSIRKHGGYLTPEKLEEVILNPDTMIRLCTTLKEEQDKRRALEIVNSQLTIDKQIMQPKADYFDELVERNLLTSFRETAKQLEIKEKAFIAFLIDKKYIYRDKKGKLMPYADKNNGLFEVKECFNEKTQWSGTQTLITPKGRETFRLLYLQATA